MPQKNKSAMGAGGLASFGKSTPAKAEPGAVPESAPTPVEKAVAEVVEKAKPRASKRKPKAKEKTATLNIQVTRSQQRWLQDTAQNIRDNNLDPVPGPDRVYPVHLIQAAIELLKSQDVPWDEITDIEGLKDALRS